MPRTALTKTAAPGSYPTAMVALTLNVVDASNHNDFPFTGDELVLVINTHATVAKTVSILSSADTEGRTGDITAESLAANIMHMYGPFVDKTGWRQTANKFNIDGQTTDVKIAVLSLPLGA